LRFLSGLISSNITPTRYKQYINYQNKQNRTRTIELTINITTDKNSTRAVLNMISHVLGHVCCWTSHSRRQLLWNLRDNMCKCMQNIKERRKKELYRETKIP
jgi:NAD-dependent oxidoreductase involved in siderophore biosynthesis